MASLGASLGNASASSLLRSASSLQAQITANQDAAMRSVWEQSGYNDAAFQEYSNYLTGRITQLQSTGSVADSTKAITMHNEWVSASHSNTSYQIQQENNALMMAGDAGTSSGYEQKMGVIADQYNRALSVGDNTLAESLKTQYLSTDQSRQAALQSEATAQQDIYKANVEAFKANNAAAVTGFNDAKSAIHDSIGNLMANLKNPAETMTDQKGRPAGSAADVNKQLGDYVKTWGPTYKALTGKDLPSGKQLTVAGLMEASFNAKIAYDVQAAKSLGGSDPTAAAKFATFDANGNVIGGDALKVLNNTDYYSVPGVGNMNFKEAMNWAAVPNLYRQVSVDGVTQYKKNAVTGYAMINGMPMEVSNGEDKLPSIDKAGSYPGSGVVGNIKQLAGAKPSQQITQQLVKAGFGDVKMNSDGTFTTKLTAQSDHWLRSRGLNPDLASSTQSGVGNEIKWRLNGQGGLDAITGGGRLVHLAFDTNGRAGLFQTLPNGSTAHIAGQYGFNNSVNTLIGNATTTQLRFKQAQMALAAQTAKTNTTVKGLVSGAQQPLAGSFMATHPTAGGGQPSHYIGPQAAMSQRAGGGFNFTQNGQSISAARYAQLTNTPFRTLLQTMATRGDSGARAALGFVGNDFGYDPGHIGSNASTYNALTWGVHAPAGGAAPAPSPSAQFGGGANIGGLKL